MAMMPIDIAKAAPFTDYPARPIESWQSYWLTAAHHKKTPGSFVERSP
jgi:hypothetical protein